MELNSCVQNLILQQERRVLGPGHVFALEVLVHNAIVDLQCRGAPWLGDGRYSLHSL